MKARILAIGAGAVAIVAAVVLAVTAAAAPLPVVYGVPGGHVGSNYVHGTVRPTGTLAWTGDGSAWFVIHSYRSWSASGAQAGATVHVRSCWGSCFRYRTARTTLHFYRVRTHRGQPYFTRLHFSLAHRVAGLKPGTLQFCPHGVPAWYYRC